MARWSCWSCSLAASFSSAARSRSDRTSPSASVSPWFPCCASASLPVSSSRSFSRFSTHSPNSDVVEASSALAAVSSAARASRSPAAASRSAAAASRWRRTDSSCPSRSPWPCWAASRSAARASRSARMRRSSSSSPSVRAAASSIPASSSSRFARAASRSAERASPRRLASASSVATAPRSLSASSSRRSACSARSRCWPSSSRNASRASRASISSVGSGGSSPSGASRLRSRRSMRWDRPALRSSTLPRVCRSSATIAEKDPSSSEAMEATSCRTFSRSGVPARTMDGVGSSTGISSPTRESRRVSSVAVRCSEGSDIAAA